MPAGQMLRVAMAIVLIAWLSAPVVLLQIFGRPQNAGEFGDLFGSVNALFTGLAFAALIYTITIQREELKLQREELRLTREELQQSSAAQRKSADALSQQLQDDRLAREMAFAIGEFDNLNDAWSLDVRKQVFSASDVHKLLEDPDALRNIERFLNYLNHIGYLIAKELLPSRPTLELFYITSVRVWVVMAPHIEAQRARRGIYLLHLEWLVYAAATFWKDWHPDTLISIHNPMTGSVRAINCQELLDSLAQNRPRVMRYLEQSSRHER